MPPVVVIGGGLAGLVASRRLAEAGLDVTLFERRGEVGGRVSTHHDQGFTIDRGFQVLLTAYPAVKRELDLEALDLRDFPPGATIARPGHRSTLVDPFREPASAVGTLLSDAGSLRDKLRVFRLQQSLRRRSVETLIPGPATDIGTYLTDLGFSRRFIDRFFAPFYGGITLDRSLSTAAGVFEYTFKMLGEGGIAVPAGGMGAIPAQLASEARAAGVQIETATTVDAVEPAGRAAGSSSGVDTNAGGVSVDFDSGTVDAAAAVVATDPPTARSLTGIETIPTEARSCVTQYYSLPERAEFPPNGRLILNAGGSHPNHVAPISAVAPEYAPEGRQLLSATFLGRPGEDDSELAASTETALESWYPNHRFDLEPIQTERIAFAQFDQPPGTHERLPSPAEPAGSIYLAGDYTRWSSIQGALESGRLAAAAVARDRC